MSTTPVTKVTIDPQVQWAVNVVFGFASVSCAVTLSALCLTGVYRNRASFVFSQPSFLAVLLVGILLLQLSQFFLALSLLDAQIYSGSSASCKTYLWLFWIGCSLSLAAQCARLYRALLVFRERSLRRPRLNTTKFFVSMGFLCMIPLGLMLIRMLVDPVQISQGVCLPMEVASNPNSIVIGLMVRLTVWTLLAVCFWFTRILQRLGATVDDAKTMSKLFFWIFLSDATITGMQSAGLPSDHVSMLSSGAIAFGTITALHAVFSLKLARVGLTGKEMLQVLRKEKEMREFNQAALKARPLINCRSNSCCGKLSRKETQLEPVNPQADIPPSSRAPPMSFQDTAVGDGNEFYQEPDGFLSDIILASMASRPVSHGSLILPPVAAANNNGNRNSVEPPSAAAASNNPSFRLSMQRGMVLAAVPPSVAVGTVVFHPTASDAGNHVPQRDETSSSSADDAILASIN